MANEPLAGRRITQVTERRTKTEWAKFLDEIAGQYPQAKKIILVMDNLNTRCSAGALYEAYRPQQTKRLWDRFEFVYTPKHGSWLNVAEAEISVMVRQCLNRRIESMQPCVRRLQRGSWRETVRRRKWTGSLRRKMRASS